MSEAAKAHRSTLTTLALIPWGVGIALRWLAVVILLFVGYAGAILALPGMAVAALAVACGHLLDGDWRSALKVRARLYFPEPEDAA